MKESYAQSPATGGFAIYGKYGQFPRGFPLIMARSHLVDTPFRAHIEKTNKTKQK